MKKMYCRLGLIVLAISACLILLVRSPRRAISGSSAPPAALTTPNEQTRSRSPAEAPQRTETGREIQVASLAPAAWRTVHLPPPRKMPPGGVQPSDNGGFTYRGHYQARLPGVLSGMNPAVLAVKEDERNDWVSWTLDDEMLWLDATGAATAAGRVELGPAEREGNVVKYRGVAGTAADVIYEFQKGRLKEDIVIAGLASPPAGVKDLAVNFRLAFAPELEVRTENEPAPAAFETGRGIQFYHDGRMALQLFAPTARDARGRNIPTRWRFRAERGEGELTVLVPAEGLRRAVYPVTIDPSGASGTPPFGKLRMIRNQELHGMNYQQGPAQYHWWCYELVPPCVVKEIYAQPGWPCLADPQDITCGDLNGDNFDELIVLKRSVSGQTNQVLIYDDDNKTQYIVDVLGSTETVTRIAAGDVNGDGLDDLLVVYSDGGSYGVRLLQTRDSFQFWENWVVTSYANISDVVAADVDGDLSAEVAIVYEHSNGEYNATIEVYKLGENNEFDGWTVTTQSCKQFSAWPEGWGWNKPNMHTHAVHPLAIAAADLQRDGKDELIVLNDYWDLRDHQLHESAMLGNHWVAGHSHNIEAFCGYTGCPPSPMIQGLWEKTKLVDLTAGDCCASGTNRVFAVSSDCELHYSKPYDPCYVDLVDEGHFPVAFGITNIVMGDADGDSLVAEYVGCYTHLEHVMGAYQELPPAWDGVNLEGSTVSISQGTTIGNSLQGEVELTTEMSIGLEVEADMEILQMDVAMKYKMTEAMAHFDSVQREFTQVSGFQWPWPAPSGELFQEDGVLVFDQSQNIYEYKVINARPDLDPSYFIIIGAAEATPWYWSRSTYEAMAGVNLGSIGGHVAGHVATYPTSPPTPCIDSEDPQGVGEGGPTMSLTYEETSEIGDRITTGSGYDQELAFGAFVFKVVHGISMDLQTNFTFSTKITTNTSYDAVIAGTREYDARYTAGMYLKKETRPDGKREYIRQGFYVPSIPRGDGFLDPPTLDNFSGPDGDIPADQKTAHIQIEVYDSIGIEWVTYQIKQGSTVLIPATAMGYEDTKSTTRTYTAEIPITDLPQDTDLTVEVTATDNNNNTAVTNNVSGFRWNPEDESENACAFAFRIVNHQDDPPVPVITGGNYLNKYEGDNVTISGSAGEGATLTWNFGDGSALATGTSAQHNYYKYGDYTVTMRAVGTNGKTAITNLVVTISNEPPSVWFCVSTNTIREGRPLEMSGGFTDPGKLAGFTANWDFGDGSTWAGRCAACDTNGGFIVTPQTHVYRPTADTNVTLQLTVSDGKATTTVSTNVSVKHNQPPGTPTVTSTNLPEYGHIYDLDLLLPLTNTIRATWYVTDPENDTVSCSVYLTRDLSLTIERDANLVPDSVRTNQEADLPIHAAGFYYWEIVAADEYGGVSRSDLLSFEVDETAPEWPGTAGITQAILEGGDVTVSFDEATDTAGVKYNLYTNSQPLAFSEAERVPDVPAQEGSGLWANACSVALNLPLGKVYYFGVRAEDRAESYPGYSYPGGSRSPNEEQNTVSRMAYATPGTGVTWSLQQLTAQAVDDLGNHILTADGNGVFTSAGSLTISMGDTLIIATNETLLFDDDTGSYTLNVIGTLQSADYGNRCPSVLVVASAEEQGSPVSGADSLFQSLQTLGFNVTCRTGLVSTATYDSYDAIFVALGCAPFEHTLTVDEAAQLEGYLTNGVGGHALYMESGRCWSQGDMASLCGCFSVAGMPGPPNYFQGMTGTGLAAGLYYPAPWTGESGMVDQISPIGDGLPLMMNDAPYCPTMISSTNAQGWQTVASVAEFGGLANNPAGSGGLPLIQAIMDQALVPEHAGQCANVGPKSIGSVDGNPGDWHGITASLRGNGGSVLLTCTTIADAQTALAGSGAVVDLEGCTIQNCAGNGVVVDASPQVTIARCSIRNNGGTGFKGTDHPGSFQNNTVTGNAGNGVGYAQPNSVATFVIQNNTIQQNGNNGVCLGWASANVLVANNQVSQNGAAGIYIAVYGMVGVPQIRNNTVTFNQDGCCFVDGAQPKVRGNTIVNNTRYGIYVFGSAADLGDMGLAPADPGKNIIHSSGSGYDAYNATPAPGGCLVMAEGNTWNVNRLLPPIQSQFYPGPLTNGFDYCPFAGGDCDGEAEQTLASVSAVQRGSGIDASWTVSSPNPLTDFVLHYGYAPGDYPFALSVGTNLSAHIDEVPLGCPVFLAVSAFDQVVGTRLLPSAETNLAMTWADLAIVPLDWPGAAVAGQPVPLSFLVTNRGPALAPAVRVTNTLPVEATVSNIIAGCGSFTVMASQILFDVGDMAPASGNAFAFDLTLTNSALVQVSNVVQVSSDLPDAAPGDNWTMAFITCQADDDRDGMPDDWEALYGFSSTNSLDAVEDLDGDGISNLGEYLAGTRPNRATSVLQLHGIRVASGVVHITFATATGRQYALERCTNLASPAWVPAQDQLPGNGQPLTVLLSNEPPAEATYYRVHLVR